jgi:hypothetical protein
LAPEIKPSSSSQNSSERQGLLYILLSAFAFFSGWSSAKLSAPNQDVGKTIPPQDSTGEESNCRQFQSAIVSEMRPSPPKDTGTDKRKDHTPLWKKLIEWGTLLVAIGLLVVNIYQMSATKKAANAAKDSVDIARKNAHFDQRAWLGITYGTYKYTVNQIFGATYDVTDTGKTPARNVNGMAVTRFMRIGDTPSFTYEHGTTVELGTMLPNVRVGAVSWLIPPNVRKEDPIQAMKISDEMSRALKDGGGYMMIYGNIGYDSVFGAHHRIKFCATSGPTFVTQPKECVDYNDVDNNEEP